MRIDTVMDLAWGSCGKGGIAGWLAKRNNYDAIVCAYGRQAGHTYNDAENGISIMVQQLPIGAVINDTATKVFLGPGSIIHVPTLMSELERYGIGDKELYIHEAAAIVTDDHAQRELDRGQTKMGSTAKGVGQAAIDRILRDPGTKVIARDVLPDTPLSCYLTNKAAYDEAMLTIDGDILLEGAQGFGLSLYHGEWPYTTSRDVTPAQLMADVGLPRSFQKYVKVIGVTRTRPIRVNNRDGHSGPAYPGQRELTWEELGQEPEKTTVTQLERRVFDFSLEQVAHAAVHCLDPRTDCIAVTFADYIGKGELNEMCNDIFRATGVEVKYLVEGPDDADVSAI